MEQSIPAKAGEKPTLVWLLSVLTFFAFMLSACASSEVSRNAASNVDLGLHNASKLVGGASDSNIATSYQNSSQAMKGAFMGGAVGAVTGLTTSSIGFLPGTMIGAIFGAAYGSYIDAHATEQDRLINRGVNVIALGDQILIVIPSWRVFNPYTTTINPQSYSTLQLVSNYINHYVKMLVKISVYTARTRSQSADCAFATQQADKIERFLIASGIDARVLYAMGYGGTNLVEENSLDWGSNNYRIEITLEKQYV